MHRPLNVTNLNKFYKLLETRLIYVTKFCPDTHLLYQPLHIYKIYKIYTLKH